MVIPKYATKLGSEFKGLGLIVFWTVKYPGSKKHRLVLSLWFLEGTGPKRRIQEFKYATPNPTVPYTLNPTVPCTLNPKPYCTIHPKP